MYTGWYAKKSTRCGGRVSLSLTHVECVPAQLQHQPMLLLLGKNLKPLFYLKYGGGGGEKKSDLLTVDKDN